MRAACPPSRAARAGGPRRRPAAGPRAAPRRACAGRARPARTRPGARASASRRSSPPSVGSDDSNRKQYDWSAPRPTRPRSWWSCASPNRSAFSTTIAVAFGMSMPTSITVVATSTWVSRAANARIAAPSRPRSAARGRARHAVARARGRGARARPRRRAPARARSPPPASRSTYAWRPCSCHSLTSQR